jgi:DNA-binding NtrC family response regulator
LRILLLTPTPLKAAALASEFSQLGLEVQMLEIGENEEPTVLPSYDAALLVVSALSVLEIGERVARARQVLGLGSFLVVCCPQLTPADRLAVTSCGASSILTPRNWEDASAVAERVLGELLVTGSILPRNCGELWGGTMLMRELYRQIETLAHLDETILIVGETGTGKERVAQEIHHQSRRSGPFMAVNCAEFTPELLASELFGHARGAFSGAVERRRGLLVAVGEGTFFLDEIGDLAPPAQAKLLRVLEERKVRPVGSNDWEPLHCRVLLATRRDLESAPDEQFRRDLYERIRGFSIRLPSLRERRADIPLLVQRFVDEYNQEYPGDRTIPPGVIDSLFRHAWPGNVRELRLAVRLAAAYASGPKGFISARHLLEAPNRSESLNGGTSHVVRFDPMTETWRHVQDKLRINYFQALIAETNGNRELAASRAGLSRSQLYEILKQISEIVR